jgi:PilZ domain
MQSERRRAIRYHFGGVAEVIDSSGKHCVALCSDLSLFGCLLKTADPIPAGTVVDLKITHGSVQISARGKVTHSQPSRGMGVAFGPIGGEHQAILDKWLAEASR